MVRSPRCTRRTARLATWWVRTTIPGLARPWGFLAPRGPDPGRTPGPGGAASRLFVSWGLATGAGWASLGAGCWSATWFIYIRVWDNSIPANGGNSGGPDPGAPATPLAGVGPLGLHPGRGLGACLAFVGRRRLSRLPRPSAPLALRFGEMAGATGLHCCTPTLLLGPSVVRDQGPRRGVSAAQPWAPGEGGGGGGHTRRVPNGVRYEALDV